MTNSKHANPHVTVMTPALFKESLDDHLYESYPYPEPFLYFVLTSLGLDPNFIPVDHSIGWTAYSHFSKDVGGEWLRDQENASRIRTLAEWTPEQKKLIHAVYNLIPASMKL